MELRKSSFISLVLGALLTNVAFAEKALDSFDESCTLIRATGNSESPPSIWQSHKEPGRLVGAIPHIVNELSKRIGLDILMTSSGVWSQAQNEVKIGVKDLLAGALYTNERANYMEYLEPVIFYARSLVWQNKQHIFSFDAKDDLEGKWGVTVINHSFGEEFDTYARQHLNILTVSSVQKALELLADGRADYFLYEETSAMVYINLLNLADKVVSVGPPISSEGIYLTMSKQSSCRTPAIKQKIEVSLRDMINEGFINEAVKKGIEEWQLE